MTFVLPNHVKLSKFIQFIFRVVVIKKRLSYKSIYIKRIDYIFTFVKFVIKSKIKEIKTILNDDLRHKKIILIL